MVVRIPILDQKFVKLNGILVLNPGVEWIVFDNGFDDVAKAPFPSG